MAVPTSAWSKDQPSGSSSIRDGDDTIRSHQSVLEAVLNDEHYFALDSASSASGGVHKPGSARIYGGLRSSMSTPSSADSAGRLYYATDTRTLHYWGASSTTTVVYGNYPFGCIASSSSPLPLGSAARALIGYAAPSYLAGLTFSGGTVTIPSGGDGIYAINGVVDFSLSADTGCLFREVQILVDNAGQVAISRHVSEISTLAGVTQEYIVVSAIVSASSGSKFYLAADVDTNSHVSHMAGATGGSFSIVRIA